MPEFFDEYYPYVAQINSRNYADAVVDALKLLREVQRLSPNEYRRTPKGTPFYLLGFASFLSHDYQTATFFFEAALAEDLKHQPLRKDTPAVLFMQLEDKNPNQAALHIVKQIVVRLDEVILAHNARGGSTGLSIEEIRNNFLSVVLADKPHRRSLATTFISFLAEWDFRASLVELTEAGSREPFFLHLFRGCLLFESLLKENPKKTPNSKTLRKILNKEMFAELHIPSSLKINSPSFDTILRGLSPGQAIAATIECTGMTRNTLGHNLVWATQSLDAKSYNLLAENIAVSCLHAISCLYR